MLFNAIKFYSDNHIIAATKGSKHCRPGWINIHCPFCGGSDFHLGFHINTGAYNCWKCGHHDQVSVIEKLLNCDWYTAKEIQDQYTTQHRIYRAKDAKEFTLETKNKVCKLPIGTGPLNDRHRQYLRGRGYNADILEQVWSLKSVGNLGPYKFRVLAPIILDGQMVSYQARDVTGKSSLRYKACRKEDEVIEHQDVVYGLDYIKKGGSCVLVEGIADVWRLGPGATCCFGTAFTIAQINLLASYVQSCYIMFDSDDDNAVKMARVLAVTLSGRGINVEILELDQGDPGEMDQQEADDLMRELGLKQY